MAGLDPGGRARDHRPPMSIADAQRLRTARSSLEGHEGSLEPWSGIVGPLRVFGLCVLVGPPPWSGR